MENTNTYEINCIGVDEKLHMCLPWQDITLCGMRVKIKTVKDFDWANRVSCYECTFDAEE